MTAEARRADTSATRKAGFTPEQRRQLQEAFATIDASLADAECALAASGAAGPSPRLRVYPLQFANATPVQQKVTADYAATVREVIRAALRRHEMTPPPCTVGATWAAGSHLRNACIAAEKLAPRHLPGGGDLAPDLVRDLNLTSGRLMELLEQVESYLAPRPQPGLPERLASIDAPQWRRLLAELAQVIDAHSLSSLRTRVGTSLGRIEAPALEVAWFGRVNSGKSALLNRVLGRNVLPVGVTPVTAIAIHIVHGARPEGTAWFVEAKTETFDLGRMAEFASAHQNPFNMRHVTRLQVALPAAVLVPGVTLIDTPGFGAATPTSTAETFAYVHRCDIGVVLVDAGATLTGDDTVLVDALPRAGAQVMVLVSKSDLLSEEDRFTAQSDVESRLRAGTGQHVPVFCVGVRGEAGALCDRWVATVLSPCMQQRQQLRHLSLVGKIVGLKADVIAGLECRLACFEERAPLDASTALAAALARLDRLRAEPPVWLPNAGAKADEILAESAHNAGVIWLQDLTPAFDVTAILIASIEGRAAAAAATLQRRITAARADLVNALGAAEHFAPAGAPEPDPLPRAAAPPTLHAISLVPPLVLAKPRLPAPIRPLLAACVRRDLERRGLKQLILRALAGYDEALTEWNDGSMDALRRDFVEQMRRVETQRGAAGKHDAASMRADLDRLRRLTVPEGDYASEFAADPAPAEHAPQS
ncbi:MAG TPA: dynamin family protein [Burkholderiaceae bacterium]|nr:dynamin family protein [Burkholderiaceae bacterium]